jgi:ribosomal protein S18 acetylase RimI-like enzyme
MKITVREAVLEDFNALCELFDEMDALHRVQLPHLFQKPDGPARDQQAIAELIADAHAALLVADTGGELVGFVHAMLKEPPANAVFLPRLYALVDGLVVKTGFQQHGIGKVLMEEIHTWASAKGASAIELNVYEFNENAIAFYERLGYQTLSRKMGKALK